MRAAPTPAVTSGFDRYHRSLNYLHWTYATDFVGNITSISDQLDAANNRSFGYQDYSYFLTQAAGPWANAAAGGVAWTYDKIGNRLTETRGASPTATSTSSTEAVPEPRC